MSLLWIEWALTLLAQGMPNIHIFTVSLFLTSPSLLLPTFSPYLILSIFLSPSFSMSNSLFFCPVYEAMIDVFLQENVYVRLNDTHSH